jgi:hypothetical protein
VAFRGDPNRGAAMMTEHEWLTSPTLGNLLQEQENMNLLPLTERKLRLLACAKCRYGGRELSYQHRKRIEVAEAFADGRATRGQLLAGRSPRASGWWGSVESDIWLATYPSEGQLNWSGGIVIPARPQLGSVLLTGPMSAYQRAYIRDIFGNPFRPVSLDPAWLTSDVVALARGIYDDRAFDRMPILADALQDTGCANDDILNHCRDTSLAHVRGCWVVDLLLGKE